MARLLLLLLATAVLVAQACIPVANVGMNCKNRVITKNLGCGACTVTDVLKVTGLSLFDFILLQNGGLDGGYAPIYPTTVIDGDSEICIAGNFS